MKLFVDETNRRTKLPYLVPGNKKSAPMWQILSKVIKQDLTKIPMPVTINEPTSTLQKLCEMMANAHLLQQATSLEKEPIKRLLCAAIFSIV